MNGGKLKCRLMKFYNINAIFLFDWMNSFINRHQVMIEDQLVSKFSKITTYESISFYSKKKSTKRHSSLKVSSSREWRMKSEDKDERHE